MAPGVFLMWLAFAAASVGVLDYFMDLSWQLEFLVFAGFSLVCVYLAGPGIQKAGCRTATSPISISAFTALSESPLCLPNPSSMARANSISKEPAGMCWDQMAKAPVRVTAVEGMKLRVTEA